MLPQRRRPAADLPGSLRELDGDPQEPERPRAVPFHLDDHFPLARFGGFERRHWVRGVVLGTVALAIPNTLFTLGLEDLPVSIGGLLIALIPIATVGAAHFLVEGERFNPRSIPGFVTSLVGTGILVGLGGESIEGVGNLWRGVGVSLIAVVLAGTGGALTRRFALEVGVDRLVIPQFATATILGILAMPFLNTTPPSSIETEQWVLLLALGVLATAIPSPRS